MTRPNDPCAICAEAGLARDLDFLSLDAPPSLIGHPSGAVGAVAAALCVHQRRGLFVQLMGRAVHVRVVSGALALACGRPVRSAPLGVAVEVAEISEFVEAKGAVGFGVWRTLTPGACATLDAGAPVSALVLRPPFVAVVVAIGPVGGAAAGETLVPSGLSYGAAFAERLRRVERALTAEHAVRRESLPATIERACGDPDLAQALAVLMVSQPLLLAKPDRAAARAAFDRRHPAPIPRSRHAHAYQRGVRIDAACRRPLDEEAIAWLAACHVAVHRAEVLPALGWEPGRLGRVIRGVSGLAEHELGFAPVERTLAAIEGYFVEPERVPRAAPGDPTRTALGGLLLGHLFGDRPRGAA